MPSRCCIHYVSKSGRPSSGHRTGKGQFSSQFPQRVVLKNVQIIRQSHSSPMLARSCLKSWRTKNFQTTKLGLEKAEEPEIKLPTLAGSQRKQRNSRKTSTSVSLTTWKPLTVWIITNCGKLSERWEYQIILPVSWETCMGWEATVRTLYRTTDRFWIEKGVRQGCLPSLCLFNLYAEHIMKNAGLDELQAGVKIGRRNINNLRYADDTILMAESKEELKSLLMRVKEES